MNEDLIIKFAKNVGLPHWYQTKEVVNIKLLQEFAKLVAEHEREAISDEWWSCYQSDLENGVKSLNEYEAKKFATTYPELAKFGSWLEARSNP
jgi:hypothetical protein